MRIAHNMMAINTHRQLAGNQLATQKSTEKLSSGYRINRAADDAAGLTISEKMRAQIRGLERASSNAQDGISMIQAAEGALQESHSILQRMRELTVQGANGVPGVEDRDAILSELEQLGLELDRIAGSTNFNGKYILTGWYDANADEMKVDAGQTPQLQPAEVNNAINLQAGANANGGDVISVNIRGVSRRDLLGDDFGALDAFAQITDGDGGGIAGGQGETIREDNATGFLDVNDSTGEWHRLLRIIDGNIDETEGTVKTSAAEYTGLARVSDLRSTLGAVQNRLEHTVANVDTVAENMQSAEARIRDVDMAKEMMNYTKNNILNQAATAMLAQANQAPQSVLQLLQ